MKKLILVFILLLSVKSGMAQDLYSRSEPSKGLILVYAGTYYQSEDSVGTAPVHFTGQGSHIAGQTDYNPYNLVTSTTYDSVGACTIVFDSIPGQFSYTTSDLYVYATSTFYSSYFITTAAVIKSGVSIKAAVFNNQFGGPVDGYLFTIFLYILKN